MMEKSSVLLAILVIGVGTFGLRFVFLPLAGHMTFSPRLIREFHLFAIADHAKEDDLVVDSIHDERGYKRVRKLLAHQHAQEIRIPDVQVVQFDRDGDRSLTLRHVRRRGRPLTEEASEVLAHMRRLWGFTVRLETWENDGRVDDALECAA